jgi:predicted ATPase
MLDWSHNLLLAAERVVVRRLGVFSGNFSFGTALSVVAGFDIADAQAANAVASLVATSLIVTRGGSSARYDAGLHAAGGR